jgi:hypothetical protein
MPPTREWPTFAIPSTARPGPVGNITAAFTRLGRRLGDGEVALGSTFGASP